MPVHERMLTVQSHDHYAVHEMLEGIIKPPGVLQDARAVGRQYHWCPADTNRVLLRSVDPGLLPALRKIEIPPAGTRVEFAVMAYVRFGGHGRRRPGGRVRPARRGIGDAANRSWMIRQAAGAGVTTDDDDIEYWPETVTVNRPGRLITGQISCFRGFGRVCDPAALEVALAYGIGGLRAFGFGLLRLATMTGTA